VVLAGLNGRLALLFTGVIVAGASAIAGSQSAPRQRPHVPDAIAASINAALEAYANGDDLAVERLMATRDGSSSLPYVGRVMSDGAAWSRARAAFVLEAAALARTYRVHTLLDMGRALVMGRAIPLEDSPSAAADRRFEWLWHQAAIGILQGHRQIQWQHEYLTHAGPRLDALGVDGSFQSRLPLMRATIAASLCCWKKVPGEAIQHAVLPARPVVSRDDAVALFAAAASAPALRAEALIRAGKLLHEAGRDREAAAWFDRIDDAAVSDLPAFIRYVSHLTHGRVLDALDRPAEAALAYRAALRVADDGQLAGIGLAAALLRSGQPEQASAAAASARQARPRDPFELAAEAGAAPLWSAGSTRPQDDRMGPLRDFQRGDARFVRAWLAEIRTLRR